MAHWLKRGAAAEAKAEADRKLRDVVESILGDIEARGDAALRDLSIKFDGWDRDSYLLTDAEMQACLDQLSAQDLKDIEFAHAAYSRSLPAGTIIGSGTVLNENCRQVGSSCIAERRGIEIIDLGAPKTGFMRFGDRVRAWRPNRWRAAAPSARSNNGLSPPQARVRPIVAPNFPDPFGGNIAPIRRRHCEDEMKLKSLVVVIAALCCSSVAYAHHSFALFDRSKLTTLSGTVREWKWANPHTWLTVVVRKANGVDEEWALVGSSPNMMIRWGWNAADIKVGDKVMVDIHPARDGKPIGELHTVFLAGGKVLADPGGQSGEALAGGPSNLPTKPQGQPYQ